MGKDRSQSVTFRCPAYLYKALVEAAESDSPANTLSREIVERLARSFTADLIMPSQAAMLDEWPKVVESLKSEIADLKAKVEGKK